MSRYKKPSKKGSITSVGEYRRCYHDHPPMEIKVNGKTYKVYGGSCSKPIVTNADIYVGLDYSMVQTERSFPWTKGEEIRFLITDGKAPSKPKHFKALISYLENSILEGKRVHVGCIGGHGRTGTVLAALVSQMTGELDATTYVRDVYCHKVVETKEQITFLKTYYKVIPVEPSKPSVIYSGNFDTHHNQQDHWTQKKKSFSPNIKKVKLPEIDMGIDPIECEGDVWGSNNRPVLT